MYEGCILNVSNRTININAWPYGGSFLDCYFMFPSFVSISETYTETNPIKVSVVYLTPGSSIKYLFKYTGRIEGTEAPKGVLYVNNSSDFLLEGTGNVPDRAITARSKGLLDILPYSLLTIGTITCDQGSISSTWSNDPSSIRKTISLDSITSNGGIILTITFDGYSSLYSLGTKLKVFAIQNSDISGSNYLPLKLIFSESSNSTYSVKLTIEDVANKNVRTGVFSFTLFVFLTPDLSYS